MEFSKEEKVSDQIQSSFKKSHQGTSLVIQQLSIHPPVPGLWFDPGRGAGIPYATGN